MLLLSLWAACGPMRYVAQVGGPATTAVAQAEREGAAVYAPYEYTSATEYLRKAREEASRSQFQTALSYGRTAEEMANRARALTRERKSAGNRGDLAPGDALSGEGPQGWTRPRTGDDLRPAVKVRQGLGG